jgi:hypothetical protein
MSPKSRFYSSWDEPDVRIDVLEEQLGQVEVERDILREMVEQGRDLIKNAEFTDQGDYYDAMHWLAEVDLYLEAP